MAGGAQTSESERFLLLTAKNKLKKWYEQQGKIQTEGSGQEEKAARRPDSGQEGYYVQAEWNAFLEQIFSMQELLIWKFYYENGFSCAEIGGKDWNIGKQHKSQAVPNATKIKRLYGGVI